jgi:hypothetical protein
MQPDIRIPAFDPMPLPGPVWLMLTLLLVTFTLHVLAMNAAFGGGLWTLFNLIRGRSDEHPYSRRLSQELARMLPVLLAFTITLGVAALLFVQVLYGQFLYSSSILIGAVWICVIPLVIVAYYGYYYVSNTQGRAKGRTIAVAALSVACLASVGFIFTNNMTLMLRPDRWIAMYHAHPNGWNLNLGEPLVIPRYLHMMVGAVAVFSAILAHLGMVKMKKDHEYGRWIVRRAAQMFALFAGFQFLIGMWMLLSVPKPVLLAFMRDPLAGSVFGVALLSVVASIMLMLIGSSGERPNAMVHAGFGMMVVTLALMIVMRHLLREAFLKPYLEWGSMQVQSQTSVIVIFLLLFVAGLGTVSYMVAQLSRGARNAEGAVKTQVTRG